MKKILVNNLRMIKYIYYYCPIHIIVTLFISILSSLISIVNLLYLRNIINCLESYQNASNILKIVLIMLFINLGFMLINAFINKWIVPKNILEINKGMQLTLMEKIASLDYEFYENKKFYDMLNMATQQSDSRALSVLDTFSNIIANLLSIGALFSLIGMFDASILIFILLNVFVNIIINFKTTKLMHDYYENRIQYSREINYVQRVFYLPYYAKELRMFPEFNMLMEDKLVYNIHELILLLKKFSNNMIKKIAIGSFLSTVFNAVITILLAFKVIEKKLKISDFITLSSGSTQLISKITQFISILPNLYEHSIYIDNFNQFMNYKPKTENKVNAINFPNDYVIRFDNVFYKYLDTSEYAVKNVSMVIKKGEKIALVGRNGSGKSTIVKLLCRLYDPVIGKLTINDISYDEYDIQSLRSKIGIVFQDQQIFSISIAENILMRPIKNVQEDTEIVNSCLKAVGLYEKVMNLKKGIFTVITREFDDDGVMFSGGEFQRLIIARIYARKNSLLILDEPSNSLDVFAEKELYDLLLKDNKIKSVIFVTHQLTNVQKADCIYFIDNGVIKEFGTHEYLMSIKKDYYSMYNTQVKGYL